ncbi:MAG: hypothetical protein GC160_26995 [Acidobacteria bacterium]|nr:hypothetical protein [Acidobacteriota bacterium]
MKTHRDLGRPGGLADVARTAALAVLALGALGCAELGVGGSGPEGAGGSLGYDAPITVQLHGVVAGVVGTGVLVENHSTEALENVEIVVNENAPSGGFRFRTPRVPAGSTQTYLSQVFRTADGASLDPLATQAGFFSVYADTPRGRGGWRGGYEDQQ